MKYLTKDTSYPPAKRDDGRVDVDQRVIGAHIRAGGHVTPECLPCPRGEGDCAFLRPFSHHTYTAVIGVNVTEI